MTHSKLLVSVIIPAYNAQSFLVESIGSVVAQTYQAWELIVVVDKSDDNTAEVASILADQDDRISIHPMPFNCGASVSRNIAIQLSRGDLIAFLDADDIWDSEKLAIQVPYFQSQNPPSIVFSSYHCFSSNRHSKKLVNAPSFAINYSSIIRSNYICTSSAVYDARQQKFYFPNLPRRQDWALWITILNYKNSYAQPLSESLVLRRVHEDSLSSNRLASYWYNYMVLRKIAQLSPLRSAINLAQHFIIALFRNVTFTR